MPRRTPIMDMLMPMPAEDLKIRLSQVGNPVIEVPAPLQSEGVISSSDLKVKYNVEVTINRPESIVEIVVTMAYLRGQGVLFSGHLTTCFEVVNLASFITAEGGGGEFRLESDFLPMLISIAFSTTRGYFVRELADSALAPYPFPMITMDNIKKRTSYQLL